MTTRRRAEVGIAVDDRLVRVRATRSGVDVGLHDETAVRAVFGA